MVKKVAVYGTYKAYVSKPVWQRFWHRRVDGIRQRYWHKIERTVKVVKSGRYEFIGTGKELYKAVIKAHHFMPKDFVTVSAREFVEYPEEYGFEGEWIEREVES